MEDAIRIMFPDEGDGAITESTFAIIENDGEVLEFCAIFHGFIILRKAVEKQRDLFLNSAR